MEVSMQSAVCKVCHQRLIESPSVLNTPALKDIKQFTCVIVQHVNVKSPLAIRNTFRMEWIFVVLTSTVNFNFNCWIALTQTVEKSYSSKNILWEVLRSAIIVIQDSSKWLVFIAERATTGKALMIIFINLDTQQHVTNARIRFSISIVLIASHTCTFLTVIIFKAQSKIVDPVGILSNMCHVYALRLLITLIVLLNMVCPTVVKILNAPTA